jgi:hypothetical protein
MLKLGCIPIKRLSELRARLLDDGVVFRCPCCNDLCHLPFVSPVPQKRFTRPASKWTCRWQHTGQTVDTLTLWPAVFRECGWHGYVTNGEARTVLHR